MLQVDAPLADGRMFFRTDLVNMDAGSFSTHSDGSYSPSWGTCGEIACTSGSKNQTDSGASVAVGWKNDTGAGISAPRRWASMSSMWWGLSYSSDVGPVGYTVNVHRRPISSSLLSFGGQKDSSSHTGATGRRPRRRRRPEPELRSRGGSRHLVLAGRRLADR